MSGNFADHRTHHSQRTDFLLWGSASLIVIFYGLGLFIDEDHFPLERIALLSSSVVALINKVWWGIVIGILSVAVLTKVPREFVIAALGRNGGFEGIVRATLGGVLLDLCSHGILMVAAKLYERGATAGQVVAFLVASPWNSFSLTLILVAMIGLNWTLAFIAFSLLIALISGLVFDACVERGILPPNPNKFELPATFRFWPATIAGLKNTQYDLRFFKELITDGLAESRMVLRWIFFGVILAATVRAFVDTQSLQYFFGPTLSGLLLTMLVATILEVCSEGSAPVAADFLTRAGAPGNSFGFLMTGVSTDYTEIMVLRETTKSWKFAFFLPVVTLPQVLLVSILLNSIST